MIQSIRTATLTQVDSWIQAANEQASALAALADRDGKIEQMMMNSKPQQAYHTAVFAVEQELEILVGTSKTISEVQKRYQCAMT